MKSLPGAKTIENCEISIIKIEKNKDISCPSNCLFMMASACQLKKTIKVKQQKEFSAIVVSINIKNLDYQGTLRIRDENVILIDSDGFNYYGKIMCDALNPLRSVTDGTDIPLNSQVNYSVIFPKISSKVAISRILVKADSYSSDYIDFEIGNMDSFDNECDY